MSVGILEQPVASMVLPAEMTTSQAQQSIQQIKHHIAQAGDQIDSARAELLRFYEAQGWKALGYKGFRQCCIEEFDTSRGHIYRLLDAARLDREIKVSPIGDTYSPLPETLMRELIALNDDQREEVLDIAHAATPPGQTMTAETVSEAVDSVREASEDPASVRETSKLMDQLDPTLMATISREDAAKARAREKARENREAKEDRAKKLESANNHINTACRWLVNDGWSLEQIQKQVASIHAKLLKEMAARRGQEAGE